jgi:uncharacterized protein YerC
MIDVRVELAPREGHDDTVVQAQIRECFIQALDGLEEKDLVGVTLDCIDLLQMHLLPQVGQIRRQAARYCLQNGMTVLQLAEHTGVSTTAIARLSSEANRALKWKEAAGHVPLDT